MTQKFCCNLILMKQKMELQALCHLALGFFNTIPCYELMGWCLHLFLCLTHGRISPYSLKSNLIDSKFFCLLFRLLPGDVPFSDTRTVRGAKDVMLPQLSDHSSWSSYATNWCIVRDRGEKYLINNHIWGMYQKEVWWVVCYTMLSNLFSFKK